MLDFFKENFSLILPLFIFLFGWLLPAPKFFKLGQRVAKTIPPQLAKIIIERLLAFERGLLEDEFRGDKSIVSNLQLKDKIKGLKLDLGLEESKLKGEE